MTDAALARSVALEATALCEPGHAEIYLHADGQYEWDNCAPAAVALAAGFHASRIDDGTIVYNCRDTLVPDLLICRPDCAESVFGRGRRRPARGLG